MNILKAILTLLVLAYLPGANLYGIFFPNEILAKKLNIEPFFLKLTLYPLISFSFLGICVLILDQIGIPNEIFDLSLIIIVVSLFISDFLMQRFKLREIKFKSIDLKISRYTFLIILLSVSTITISIGIQIGCLYLISGDPWDAIKYANFIGVPNESPLSLGAYPNFWGYISFGLRVLGGLPYINMNTLLTPFNYLFINSAYLFMKSLLIKFKPKYVVLSTLLLSLFSGFFIEPLLSSMIFVSEFYFIYKSFAYFLFFIGCALFFIKPAELNNGKNFIKEKFDKEKLNINILSGFFLVIGFMTYLFPLLIAVLFLALFSFFSKIQHKKEYSKKFFQFIVIIFLFFLFFDVILEFYLSHIIINWLLAFLKIDFLTNLFNLIPSPLFIYSLFLVVILISYIFTLNFSNKSKTRKHNKDKLNEIYLLFYKLFLIFFIIFLIFEFLVMILERMAVINDLSEKFYFFLWLDKIYLNMGIIGILGIIFSYWCLKKHKNLFLILLSWIILSFSIAFLLIFLEGLLNFPLFLDALPEQNIFIMNYWFDRFWFYSIPSLCIFTSIGYLKSVIKLKKLKITRKSRIFLPAYKNLFATCILILSFSGIIYIGVHYGNANLRYNENQLETLDWIAENIPIHSGVVVGDNFFMGVGTDSITFVRQYFFYNIFEEDFNETKCIEQIGFLKNNTIQYAVISQFFITYFLNKSDFVNNILIPNFYNITLYNNGDLTVYYAPFFG